MIYYCCDPHRWEIVLDHGTLNGIDFLEVLDRDAPQGTPRQRTLLLRFLKRAPDLTLDNVELTGGERVTGVGLRWIMRANAPDTSLLGPEENQLPGYLSSLPQADYVLALRTDSSGDYAAYTLRLVASPGSLAPPDGIDRVLSQVDFSFKVECPSDFDCAPSLVCAEEPAEQPAISYLAKDYRSFRRLMLARMAEIMPAWRERNAADLGITLVEMLAYTADRLSYAQDAVATEAYLATARRRSSVRRHARLVDYRMHDGGNARAWIHLDVAREATVVTGDRFLTHLIGRSPVIDPDEAREVLAAGPLIFEPLHGKTLYQAHNSIDFYTWADEECCLPGGSTRATLAGDLPDLAAGDVLILEERLGPRTGREADADPERRHAVKLTAVQAGLTDALTGASITEIRWADEDATPFAFCISSRLSESVGSGTATRVSHVLGNVLLADHGMTISGEDLGIVPEPHLHLVPEPSDDPCAYPEPVPVPPRFRPVLEKAPVTQAAPRSAATPPGSAFAEMTQPLDKRRPVVRLKSVSPGRTLRWVACDDLLQSVAGDPHVVVETERDGRARLRFGDDRNGLRPASGTRFTATYRIGNGIVGNVGADAIGHVLPENLARASDIVKVRNPLPARGGAEPESIQEVREAAPFAYRRQERAVTKEDYAEVAERHPDVQRAAATFRWNGHGHTVFVTVDRFGGRAVTPEFENEMRGFLERFRMAGYDLEIDAPRFVAIELGLSVCVRPGHFRSDVKRVILERLGNRRLPDGRRGLFHPDNFSFGEPLYLSAIYAEVMVVEGVLSTHATSFRRRGGRGREALLDGVIETDRLEIIQLENDPNFPERGSIELEMAGGK